jgi:nitrate reductase NapE
MHRTGARTHVPSTDAAAPHDPPSRVPDGDSPSTRQEELRSFLFFTVVMAPVLAVLLVASYGFVVWMIHMIAGPPGPN